MFAEKIGKRGEWYDHMQEQEAHGRKEGKHEISIETITKISPIRKKDFSH